MADAYDNRWDIILLQETGLPEDTTARFSGYKAYHLPASDRRTLGCSILVKNNLTSELIANPVDCGDRTEVLGVTLRLANETLQIYNIYHHANSPLDVSELLALCATTRIFVGGDFNAHHEVIGSG